MTRTPEELTAERETFEQWWKSTGAYGAWNAWQAALQWQRDNAQHVQAGAGQAIRLGVEDYEKFKAGFSAKYHIEPFGHKVSWGWNGYRYALATKRESTTPQGGERADSSPTGEVDVESSTTNERYVELPTKLCQMISTHQPATSQQAGKATQVSDTRQLDELQVDASLCSHRYITADLLTNKARCTACDYLLDAPAVIVTTTQQEGGNLADKIEGLIRAAKAVERHQYYMDEYFTYSAYSSKLHALESELEELKAALLSDDAFRAGQEGGWREPHDTTLEDVQLIRNVAGDIDVGYFKAAEGDLKMRGNVGGVVSRACDRIEAALIRRQAEPAQTDPQPTTGKDSQ